MTLKHLIIIFSTLFFLSCHLDNKSNGKKESVTVERQEREDQKKYVFAADDFKIFYEKFMNDSAFQISNVKFPISGQYQDYEEERKWTKDSWVLMTLDFRIEMNNTDDSVSIVQDSLKFFFGTYCKGCVFSFEMEFNKIEGQWYLTHRQENNY